MQILRRPGGYQLAADAAAVDVHRFRQLVALARSVERSEDAVQLLRATCALWRGEAFATLDTPFLGAQRIVLHAERLAAELGRRDVALRSGRHAELLAELTAQASSSSRCTGVAGRRTRSLSTARCAAAWPTSSVWTRARRCASCTSRS